MTKYPTATIRIDEHLLARVDDRARHHGISRSALIKTAIMIYLAIECDYYEEEPAT